MAKSERELSSNLAKLDATTDEEIARQIAEDDMSELTDAQLAEAEIWEGDKFIRRVGRPKGSGTKELVTLRLDHVVLDHFRAGGPGWQTRLNDTLHAMIDQQQRPVRRARRGNEKSVAYQSTFRPNVLRQGVPTEGSVSKARPDEARKTKRS